MIREDWEAIFLPGRHLEWGARQFIRLCRWIFCVLYLLCIERQCDRERSNPVLDARFGILYQYQEDKMKEQIEAAMKKIRPMLQRDGGDVELVDVEDGVVKVRLQGACAGCPMSQMTIKNGIERILKQEIPEIKSVVSV